MEIIMHEVIRGLRKQKGISQEALAEAMGVTVQAVSKWECNTSYPDITLLPALAGFFSVEIGELFFGEGSKKSVENAILAELPDDAVLRVVQCRGKTLLTQNKFDPKICIPLQITQQENTISLEVQIWGSADIAGDITGNVQAGDTVNCGNVAGAVTAGDSVSCGDVAGGVAAGDCVSCGNVEGAVAAGDGVSCGNVAGAVTAGDGVTCGNVGGSVSAGNNVTCGNVEGSVEAEGDVDCDAVGGSVEADGDVTCTTVAGDVHCEGDLRYGSQSKA